MEDAPLARVDAYPGMAASLFESSVEKIVPPTEIPTVPPKVLKKVKNFNKPIYR